MKRDPEIFLKHMLECIADIGKYIADTDYEGFTGDQKTQDAVVRRIAVLGEAANNLPKTIQRANPDIEWRKIINMRNVVVHEYFGVDLELVWDVAKNNLPILESQIKKILRK